MTVCMFITTLPSHYCCSFLSPLLHSSLALRSQTSCPFGCKGVGESEDSTNQTPVLLRVATLIFTTCMATLFRVTHSPPWHAQSHQQALRCMLARSRRTSKVPFAFEAIPAPVKATCPYVGVRISRWLPGLLCDRQFIAAPTLAASATLLMACRIARFVHYLLQNSSPTPHLCSI